MKLYTGKIVHDDIVYYLFLDFGDKNNQYAMEWDDVTGVVGEMYGWHKETVQTRNQYL